MESQSGYKKPFSVSQLVIALFLSTYFLSVAMIEFSLSMFVLKERKVDLYRDYLIFKREALLWKSWQLITSTVVPLSVIDSISSLWQIFTKKATLRRNVLDVLKAFQLFSILYTTIFLLIPLETKMIETSSFTIAENLNYIQRFSFSLNILGLLIPLLRYRDWQTEKISSNTTKKTQ